MALHHTVRTLAAVPTFAELEPEALRIIAFSAEMRIFRAGDVLFSRGEVSDCGYALLSGTVALEDGQNAQVVKAPALLGDAALICETARPATAKAREPSSVLKIPRELFRRVISDYPDSAARLRRTLAARLAMLHGELHEAARTMVQD